MITYLHHLGFNGFKPSGSLRSFDGLALPFSSLLVFLLSFEFQLPSFPALSVFFFELLLADLNTESISVDLLSKRIGFAFEEN